MSDEEFFEVFEEEAEEAEEEAEEQVPVETIRRGNDGAGHVMVTRLPSGAITNK